MSAMDADPAKGESLESLLGILERLEAIISGWEETPRSTVEAYRRAIEALHREALRRIIQALRSDPAALAAMKNVAGDEVVYAVLRHLDLVKPSLNERVEAALSGIRPMLASHGGDVRLLRVAPPKIEVEMIGACDGCSASTLTFHAGVKKAVQEACPEISEVVQVKNKGTGRNSRAQFVSPFALAGSGAWLTVCDVSELPEGTVCGMEFGGEKVALYRCGEIVTCFQDACAHLGRPIHDGEVENGIITCRHHGFRYELASGECLTATEVGLKLHAVRVVGGLVEIKLSA